MATSGGNCYKNIMRGRKAPRNDQMDEYLESIDYWRKCIAKDGSCLFRIVAEHIYMCQSEHLKVREQCVNFMETNPNMFRSLVKEPFERYLCCLRNPKEWGGHVEMSALSMIYERDFILFLEPGKTPPQPVTSNGFEKVIMLCSTGGNHFDAVFPKSFQMNSALCQSIVYEVLYNQVFKFEVDTILESVEILREQTARARRESMCSDGGSSPEGKDFANEAETSCESVSEIDAKLTKMRLSEKWPPFPYKIVKSLDPEIYRNVEYDVWIEARKEQQRIEFPINGNLHYSIGDKVLVFLDNSNILYHAHIQEINDPIGHVTVFVTELGQRHTVPFRYLRPATPPFPWLIVANNNNKQTSSPANVGYEDPRTGSVVSKQHGKRYSWSSSPQHPAASTTLSGGCFDNSTPRGVATPRGLIPQTPTYEGSPVWPPPTAPRGFTQSSGSAFVATHPSVTSRPSSTPAAYPMPHPPQQHMSGATPRNYVAQMRDQLVDPGEDLIVSPLEDSGCYGGGDFPNYYPPSQIAGSASQEYGFPGFGLHGNTGSPPPGGRRSISPSIPIPTSNPRLFHHQSSLPNELPWQPHPHHAAVPLHVGVADQPGYPLPVGGSPFGYLPMSPSPIPFVPVVLPCTENLVGPVNYAAGSSVDPVGNDLPINDVSTLRFYYNLGYEYYRYLTMIHMNHHNNQMFSRGNPQQSAPFTQHPTWRQQPDQPAAYPTDMFTDVPVEDPNVNCASGKPLGMMAGCPPSEGGQNPYLVFMGQSGPPADRMMAYPAAQTPGMVGGQQSSGLFPGTFQQVATPLHPCAATPLKPCGTPMQHSSSAVVHPSSTGIHPSNGAPMHPSYTVTAMHPTGAMQTMHSSVAAMHPTGTAMHPTGAAMHPSAAVMHPTGAAMHPTGAAIHPVGAAMHPTALPMHQTAGAMQSGGALLQPAAMPYQLAHAPLQSRPASVSRLHQPCGGPPITSSNIKC